MPTNDSSLRLKDFTPLTIASGVVTATQQLHIIAAQTGTADDLDTITVGFPDLTASGNTYRPKLTIQADSGDTITVTHEVGNISFPSGADFVLAGDKVLKLIHDGTNWIPDGGFNFASDSYLVNQGADYTTSSLTFADVDSTGDPDLELTITTTGGDVLIGFAGFVGVSGNADVKAYLDVYESVGAALLGGDDGLMRTPSAGEVNSANVSFTHLATGLSAGAHTFTLQWKVVGTTPTATMWAGAGTSNADLHPQFWCKEI